MDPTEKGGNFSTLISSHTVDFGKQSKDYATHRPGFPPRFFRKVLELLNQDEEGKATSTLEWKDLTVLDIGTGPGTVALEMAARGAKVVGLDISNGQIEAAKQSAKERKLEHLTSFAVATAEQTDQKTGTFDLVMAGQCWPWFRHQLAMKELSRVLKPRGVLCVGQFCYLPHQSPLAHDTEQLILEVNPKWTMAGGDGLYPSQVNQLVSEGGFDLIEQFSFDHNQPFTTEGWRGRMRTCNGIGSSNLPQELIDKWDRNLVKLMQDKYPREPHIVPHRIWGVVVRKPAAAAAGSVAAASRPAGEPASS